MPESNPTVLEVMTKAYEESNGEYIDLVVEHGELEGITLDHLKWWGEQLDDSEKYKLWHPESHISHKVETVKDENGNDVTYMYAEEIMGNYGVATYKLRVEAPESAPVQQKYKPLASNTQIGPNGENFGGVYHEFEPTPNGMLMRSTFRVPAKTPKEMQEAVMQHSREEMGNFPKFLPQLYAKENG